MSHPSTHFLSREALSELVAQLIQQGYTVVGPVLRDQVIHLSTIRNADEIATGIVDRQNPGDYRLEPGDAALSFQYVVGPDSAKRFLFPPQQRLVQLHIQGENIEIDQGPDDPPKLALLGMRPCDLAAMKTLDHVFAADDPHTKRCESEPFYEQACHEALIIAVNCAHPGGTCFCASMGTGPQAVSGFDLALTELRGGFVVHVASQRGANLVATLHPRNPSAAELELAELKMTRARERMGRRLNTRDLRTLLERAVEHPLWDEVAQRCLSCGNCTMVCPTCFCSTVSDTTELDDPRVTRIREWASCFTHQFSFTTAGPVRNTIRGRFRHWMRHKLSTWFDQFGESGCVGCGRCITWCPVGIDITAEARRLQDHELTTEQGASPGKASP